MGLRVVIVDDAARCCGDDRGQRRNILTLRVVWYRRLSRPGRLLVRSRYDNVGVPLSGGNFNALDEISFAKVLVFYFR